MRDIQRPGFFLAQLEQRNGSVGTHDREASVAELDIRLGRLERLRRERFPFLITSPAAWIAAEPPIIAEREPPVPAPNTSRSESLCRSRMLSNGTPRR